VVKLKRGTHTAYSEASSLRLRASWLYYNEGLTQKDVAEQLGISRTTVIRLLDEAMKRSEVQIWITHWVHIPFDGGRFCPVCGSWLCVHTLIHNLWVTRDEGGR